MGGAGNGNRIVGVDAMGEVNALLAGIIALGACGCIAVRAILLEPSNLYRLAAWAIGEAMYRSHLRAEKERARELGDDARQRHLRSFGLDTAEEMRRLGR